MSDKQLKFKVKVTHKDGRIDIFDAYTDRSQPNFGHTSNGCAFELTPIENNKIHQRIIHPESVESLEIYNESDIIA